MLSNSLKSLSLTILVCFSANAAFAGSSSQEETWDLSKVTPLKISISHPLEPNFDLPLPEGMELSQDTMLTLFDKVDMAVRKAHGLPCMQTRAVPVDPAKRHTNSACRSKPY